MKHWVTMPTGPAATKSVLSLNWTFITDFCDSAVMVPIALTAHGDLGPTTNLRIRSPIRQVERWRRIHDVLQCAALPVVKNLIGRRLADVADRLGGKVTAPSRTRGRQGTPIAARLLARAKANIGHRRSCRAYCRAPRFALSISIRRGRRFPPGIMSHGVV